MDPARYERNLEHAVWRVNFLASLLQAHRALGRRDEDWGQKEAEYQSRIAWAERELERWQRTRSQPAPMDSEVPRSQSLPVPPQPLPPQPQPQPQPPDPQPGGLPPERPPPPPGPASVPQGGPQTGQRMATAGKSMAQAGVAAHASAPPPGPRHPGRGGSSPAPPPECGQEQQVSVPKHGQGGQAVEAARTRGAQSACIGLDPGTSTSTPASPAWEGPLPGDLFLLGGK